MRSRTVTASSPYESLFWEESSPGSMRGLLTAALESFAEQGFHGTSTREIARKARMSPAALYAHFKSKEELLYRISIVLATKGLETLREAASVDGSVRDRLARVIRTHAAFHARMWTAARVANLELHALTPRHRRVIEDIYQKTKQVIHECVSSGVKAGEFEVDDISLTNVAIMSLVVSVCRWYSPEGVLSPDEVGERCAKLVMKMVAPSTRSPRQ